MTRRSRTGPVSPLFAFGAVLTAAGAVLYLHPGPGPAVLALGALALAVAAAVWVSSRKQ
ncbi:MULTISPECIES: hypothetical protein [unclassified Streptomyces]|uniref:hypothetical protein n=1 Tax=Streptomyces TaxID=1883 RepID=UPI00162981E4|nr:MULTISPECIES: hypothetical protein [unclassified Streptomyces]MCM1971295.1 hypothetical protein [Streptomyces sp. G1]WSK19799.1 hypothetical protein OG730_10780 [Streptomyces sp. NBC_01298]